jgi:nitrite reductase (NADH) large subunit
MLIARTRRDELRIEGRGTLFDLLTAAGLPVGSACSSRGICGRCVVTVLDGEERLSPPDAHERQVLARNGAGTSARLACCARIAGEGPVCITTGYW